MLNGLGGGEGAPADRAAAAAQLARVAAATTQRISKRQYREALQSTALAVIAAREALQAASDADASGLRGQAGQAQGHATSARLAADAAVGMLAQMRAAHNEGARRAAGRTAVATTADELDFLVAGLRMPAPARADEVLLFDLDDERTQPPAAGVAAPLREAGVFDLGIHADRADFDLGGRVVTEAALAGWLLGYSGYRDDPARLLRVNACSVACPDEAGGFELTVATTLLNELIVHAWALRLPQVGGISAPPDLIVTSPDPAADPREWVFDDGVRQALGLTPDEWQALTREHGDRLREMAERRFVIGGRDPRPILLLPGKPARRAELGDIDDAIVAAGLRPEGWTPPRGDRRLEALVDRAEAAARTAAGNATRIANLDAMLRRAATQGNEALSPQAVKRQAWGLAQRANEAASEAARLAALVEQRDTGHDLGGPGARAARFAADAARAAATTASIQREIEPFANQRSKERQRGNTKRALAARRVLHTAGELRAHLLADPPVEPRHPGEVRLYPARDTVEAARTLVAPPAAEGVTDVSMASDGRRLLYGGVEVAPEALAGYLFDRAAGSTAEGAEPAPVPPGPVWLNVCYAACPPSPSHQDNLRDSLAGRIERAMVAEAEARALDPAAAVDLTAPADYLARRAGDDGDAGAWVGRALVEEAGATPEDVARLRAANGPDLAAAADLGAVVGPDWPVWVKLRPGQDPEIIRQRDLLGPPPGPEGGDGGSTPPQAGPTGTEQYVQQALPLNGALQAAGGQAVNLGGFASLTSLPGVGTSTEADPQP